MYICIYTHIYVYITTPSIFSQSVLVKPLFLETFQPPIITKQSPSPKIFLQPPGLQSIFLHEKFVFSFKLNVREK